MSSVFTIAPDSPLLGEVQELWRANRATLGFYPDGAFRERAEKEQILVALEGDSVVGYLLFYTSSRRRRVRLTHLCVDKDFRGRGIACQLIAELRCRTRNYYGIGLYCRRDFDAWKLWPHLGFVAISEKPGRSEDGNELTYFWMEHPHPTLFSGIGNEPEELLKVTIDANILYDLMDRSRRGAEETESLTADWLKPVVQLCTTDELFNEIYRTKEPYEREIRLLTTRHFEHLESDTDGFLEACGHVKQLLGDPRSERDKSDQRHLARTMASDVTVFVTRDEPLLKLADKIYDRTGLSVVRPSQLVASFEELRNEREYQRDRLAGTPLQIRRVGKTAAELAEVFVDHPRGERKRDLEQEFNVVFAYPDHCQCHLIENANKESVAIYVTQTDECSVSVPIFRIRRNVLKTRLAETLSRTLLGKIVRDALTSDVNVVMFKEQHDNHVISAALRSNGFLHADGDWLKLSMTGGCDIDSTVARLGAFPDLPGVGKVVSQMQDVLSDPSFRTNSAAVLELEHTLWPCKILGCEVPNFVIPIRPRWASDLFDTGLAKSTLWGAETELALNPDSVYYRAVKPKMPNNQGRILWYVSFDNEIAGSKRIRACSQLTEVTIGQPKSLFRRFRRLGVYEWCHVVKKAGGDDSDLMALQFCDTELFPFPVGWETTQSILTDHGIVSTFQSPLAISEEAFAEIYRTGFEPNRSQ